MIYKILIWAAGITVVFWVYLLIGVAGKSQDEGREYSFDHNNFDGSYAIRYTDSKCGDLGYSFKLVHESLGLSSVSAMRKSNCRVSISGVYEGYIYSKSRPSVRVYWVETSSGVDFRD